MAKIPHRSFPATVFGITASRLISPLLSLDYRVHSAAASDLDRLTLRRKGHRLTPYRVHQAETAPSGIECSIQFPNEASWRSIFFKMRNQFNATTSTFPYQPFTANQHFIPLFCGAEGFLLTQYSLLRNMLLCQLSILKNSTAS